MGLTIKWDITYKCNLFCDHCVNGKYLNQEESEVNLQEVQSIVDTISSNTSVDYIHFLGGEPLVRSDFLQIASYLNDKKILFGFNSNGLLLSENVIAQLCSMEYFHDVVLSMEGPDEQTNDKIRGKSVFKIIIKRLEQLKDYKTNHPDCSVEITVNCVATSLNYMFIPALIDLCIEYGVNTLTILEFVEEGNAVGKGLSLDKEQYLYLIKEVAQKYTAVKDKININPKFTRPLAKDYVKQCYGLDFPDLTRDCGAGTIIIFLDNKGNIYPCDYERSFTHIEAPCSLLTEDFDKIWTSESFDTPMAKFFGDDTYKDLYPCKSCRYLQDICFPCPLSLEKTGSKEIPNCVYIMENLKKQGVEMINV